MGKVKEWGDEIARMIFDRLYSDSEVVEALRDQANLEEGVIPSSSWLQDQVAAVRDHPEMWHHSKDYWKWIGVKYDRFRYYFKGKTLRPIKVHPAQLKELTKREKTQALKATLLGRPYRRRK